MTATNKSHKFAVAAIACVLATTNMAEAANLLQGYVAHASEPLGEYTAKLEVSASDSFPKAYEGKWHCITTVTDSSVTEVSPGTIMQCDIEFSTEKDGKILAHCNQPGWTEAQSSVVSFSKTEAQLDRTAYFWADGAGGAWAARSRDAFTLTTPTTIVANSYVDQYIEGSYLGRYKTNSVLTRVDAPQATAMLYAGNCPR